MAMHTHPSIPCPICGFGKVDEFKFVKKFEELDIELEDWDFEEDDGELDIENSKVISKLYEPKTYKYGKRTYYKLGVSLDTVGYIGDGVYDVSDLEFFECDEEFNFSSEEKRRELVDFILRYENEGTLYYANAYETETLIFLSGKPKPIDRNNIKGSGFNYGSTNVIINCPEKILILAEND